MIDAIYNREELLEVIDEDWGFLQEIVDMLLEDGPKLLDAIRSGVDTADAEAVWHSAHTMKSMIGNFAAPRAFEAAYRIEGRGRSGDLVGMDCDIDTLDRELTLLVRALKELLENVV